MSKSSSSIGIWVFIVLAILAVIVGAVAGVYLQAEKIIGKPPEYVSLAKLIAGDTLPAKTMIETLESPDLRRHAQDRVRVFHPEGPEIDVGIRATEVRGMPVVNVTASGADPKYVRWFLDALVDELLIFDHELQTSKPGATPAKALERASGAVEDLQDWSKPIGSGALAGGAAGLAVALVFAVFSGILGARSETES